MKPVIKMGESNITFKTSKFFTKEITKSGNVTMVAVPANSKDDFKAVLFAKLPDSIIRFNAKSGCSLIYASSLSRSPFACLRNLFAWSAFKFTLSSANEAMSMCVIWVFEDAMAF